MKKETAALLGQQVGRIRVVDVLGEGGMGAVYVGFDDRLQRKVALKVIRSEFRLHEEAKARFLREARILSQLDHPHICTVHDLIEGDDCDFLVLELIAGQSLRQAMTNGLGHSRKVAIATQLVGVLVAVHGKGVIHRDLKPENVMITDDGNVKVLDFGLARSSEEEAAVPSTAPTLGPGETPHDWQQDRAVTASDSSRSVYVKTKLGSLLGTAGYMSPEQARGEPATAASDMYSLGLILQEMFTGEPPFEPGINTDELLKKAAEGDTLPVTGQPPDLTAFINRLKSVAPGSRPSAVDAAELLQRIIDRPRRRRMSLVAAAWVLITAFAAGMAVQWLRAERAADNARQAKMRAERIWQVAATMFYQRGEFDNAIMLYERAIEENKDLPKERARNRVSVAWVNFALGRNGQATAALRLALLDDPQLTLAPDYYTAEFYTIFEQIKQGEEPAASPSQDTQEAVESDQVRRAHALLNQGDFEAALGLLRKAVKLDPSDVDALQLMSTAASLSGRLDEAEASLRSAIELRPDDAGLALRLGEVLQAKGATAEARRVYEKIIEMYPHGDRAWAALGLLDAKLGNDELARDELRRAIEENPVQPEVQLTYGELLVKAGEYEEALEALKSAESLLRDNPLIAARAHAAMAQAYQGLTEAADPP